MAMGMRRVMKKTDSLMMSKNNASKILSTTALKFYMSDKVI